MTNQPTTETAPITFGYTNWRREYAERTAIPLRIEQKESHWHGPGLHWVMVAFDVEKQAERDFLLTDMGCQPAPAAITMQTTSEARPAAWLATREGDAFHPKVFLTKENADAWAEGVTVNPPVTLHPLYLAPTPPQGSVVAASDAQVEAAAEVIWNDLYGARGGTWDNPPKDSVTGIQMRATARAALTAASLSPSIGAGMMAVSKKPLADQDGASVERPAFEAWAKSRALDITETLGPWGDRMYLHTHVQAIWDGWLLRSALAAPQPVQGEE